jgi:IS30 family transposase
MAPKLGAEHHNARLTTDAVVEIRRLAREGISRREIGLRYGVTHRTVNQVVNRRTWRHIADEGQAVA